MVEIGHGRGIRDDVEGQSPPPAAATMKCRSPSPSMGACTASTAAPGAPASVNPSTESGMLLTIVCW